MRLEESPLLQALFTKDWLELVFLLTLLAILDYIKIVIDEKKNVTLVTLLPKSFHSSAVFIKYCIFGLPLFSSYGKQKTKKKFNFLENECVM